MSVVNQTIELGTDTACFLLFHPDDLAHRANDPLDWYDYDFAWEKETKAARLVGFMTGGDGGFCLRITDGGLTKKERHYAGNSCEFPFQVRHGAVFLDNTNALPSEDQQENPKKLKGQWIKIPNGDYGVTITALVAGDDAKDKPDDIPDYVIFFKPANPRKKINPPPRLPDLNPVEYRMKSSQKPPIDFDRSEFVFLHYPDVVLLPGQTRHFDDPGGKLTEAHFGNREQGEGELYDQSIVISESGTPPCIGFLCNSCGSSGHQSSAGSPWVYSIQFRSQQLVTVTSIRKAGKWQKAKVKLFKRPASDVSDADLREIKDRFIAYAKTNPQFKEKIRNLSFEIERLESLTSIERIIDWLVKYLKLSDTTRSKCIVGTLADARLEILGFLDTAIAKAAKKKRKK